MYVACSIATVYDSLISHNSIQVTSSGRGIEARGGAIFVKGDRRGGWDTSLKMDNSKVFFNQISITGLQVGAGGVSALGGAVYLTACTEEASIAQSDFQGNSAQVVLEEIASSSLRVDVEGGSIASGNGLTDCSLAIVDSKFTRNSVKVSGRGSVSVGVTARGGALALRGGTLQDVSLRVERSGFVSNSVNVAGDDREASVGGGAISLTGGRALSRTTALSIRNSTFHDNQLGRAVESINGGGDFNGTAVAIRQLNAGGSVQAQLDFNTISFRGSSTSEPAVAGISVEATEQSSFSFVANAMVNGDARGNFQALNCEGSFSFSSQVNRLDEANSCNGFDPLELGFIQEDLLLGELIFSPTELPHFIPAGNSVLVDALTPVSCVDSKGNSVTRDQLSRPRGDGACDIGATER